MDAAWKRAEKKCAERACEIGARRRTDASAIELYPHIPVDNCRLASLSALRHRLQVLRTAMKEPIDKVLSVIPRAHGSIPTAPNKAELVTIKFRHAYRVQQTWWAAFRSQTPDWNLNRMRKSCWRIVHFGLINARLWTSSVFNVLQSRMSEAWPLWQQRSYTKRCHARNSKIFEKAEKKYGLEISKLNH